MTRRLAAAAVPLLVSIALAACASGTGGVPSAPSTASPSPSSSAPSSSGSPTFTVEPVVSADEAVRRVLDAHPEFGRLAPRNSNLIGQCCWYDVSPAGDGYRVDVVIGSGDCQSGCIDEHRWTFRVGRSGEVELVGEFGDPLPSGALPAG